MCIELLLGGCNDRFWVASCPTRRVWVVGDWEYVRGLLVRNIDLLLGLGDARGGISDGSRERKRDGMSSSAGDMGTK